MKGLELLRPALADYELIDSGDFAKIERFGDRIVARPEPQAIWRKSLSDHEWSKLADATFRRSGREGADVGWGSDERGQWLFGPEVSQRWTMNYDHDGMHLRMRLALTGFKHVGIFPEQAANWDFIYDTLREMRLSDSRSGSLPRVLNLFAYTGGATLAARSAGADVTHVDSVRQTVGWARDNMELSGLGDAAKTDATDVIATDSRVPAPGSIRWIVDDALKFARREERRGNTYDGIILDPPAYGRGPDGEKWVLEQGIDEMLSLCARLLKPHGFFVLNLYSMGLSALLAHTAARQHFGVSDVSGVSGASDGFGREQFGELYFTDRAGKQLPLGVYYRFVR